MSGCQQFVLKLPTISVQLSRLRIFLSVMRSCTLSITVVCSATPSTTFRCPSLRPRASSLLHFSPSSGLTTDSPSFEPQGYQHPEHGDLAVKRELAKNYGETNQGASVIGWGYKSHPSMTLYQPGSSSNPHPRTMNFIEDVPSLPCSLSDLLEIFKAVGTNRAGRLSSLFMALFDDDQDLISRQLCAQ